MKQSLSFLKMKLTNNTLDQHGYARTHFASEIKSYHHVPFALLCSPLTLLVLSSSDHPPLHASVLPTLSRDPGRQSIHCLLGPLSDLLISRDSFHSSYCLPKSKGTHLQIKEISHPTLLTPSIPGYSCFLTLVILFPPFSSDYQIEDWP